jgi:hypothetical protein
MTSYRLEEKEDRLTITMSVTEAEARDVGGIRSFWWEYANNMDNSLAAVGID